jgi:hypothetical protein
MQAASHFRHIILEIEIMDIQSHRNHRVVISRDQTHVSLSQDNNATQDERLHSEENWATMLVALKDFLEH